MATAVTSAPVMLGQRCRKVSRTRATRAQCRSRPGARSELAAADPVAAAPAQRQALERPGLLEEVAALGRRGRRQRRDDRRDSADGRGRCVRDAIGCAAAAKMTTIVGRGLMSAETKACGYCGETILAVAIRCKHCQANLATAASAAPPVPQAPLRAAAQMPQEPAGQTDSFEHKFLDFAFRTNRPVNAPTVAHALRISVSIASDRLEDLAARDVVLREVDAMGQVFYFVPGAGNYAGPIPSGHVGTAMTAPTYASQIAPKKHPNALAGLLLNLLLLPGLGSIIGGRKNPGVAQLVLFLVGIPFSIVGIGIAMMIGAWIWGIVTGVQMINES